MVEVQSTNLNFHHHLLVWNTLPLSLRNYQYDKLASYLSHCLINYCWKVGNSCSQNMWVRDLVMHTPEWLTTLINNTFHVHETIKSTVESDVGFRFNHARFAFNLFPCANGCGGEVILVQWFMYITIPYAVAFPNAFSVWAFNLIIIDLTTCMYHILYIGEV